MPSSTRLLDPVLGIFRGIFFLYLIREKNSFHSFDRSNQRVHYVELTGKTPIKDRNDIVVSFNKANSPERVSLTIDFDFFFVWLKF